MAARTPLIALASLVLLAIVAACSGTSSGPAPGTTTANNPASSTPTASTTTAPTRHGAFGDCLREHGVSAPPPGPAGPPPSREGQPPTRSGTPPAPPGVDQTTWDNAMQACASLAPAPPQPTG